jgi:hypothetical protein
MKNYKSSITIIFLVSAFCVGFSSVPREINPEKAKKTVQFADQFFNSIKGQPESHEVKKTENAHVEGQIDEWHDLKYQGYKLSYYRVVPENRNILSSLSIVTPYIQLPYGLKIGVQKSSVIEALGKPTVSSPTMISFEFEDPYSQTVTFHFNGTIVSEVSWQFEID